MGFTAWRSRWPRCRRVRKNPRHLLIRSSEPIFAPATDWEKIGQVPNVVFVEGAVAQGDRALFYYGGADQYVGVAQAQIQ